MATFVLGGTQINAHRQFPTSWQELCKCICKLWLEQRDPRVRGKRVTASQDLRAGTVPSASRWNPFSLTFTGNGRKDGLIASRWKDRKDAAEHPTPRNANMRIYLHILLLAAVVLCKDANATLFRRIYAFCVSVRATSVKAAIHSSHILAFSSITAIINVQHCGKLWRKISLGRSAQNRVLSVKENRADRKTGRK